ncbi:A-kinase anchor protein 7 isoforms alpha and beta-like [Pelodytes ibericus]
MGQLCCFPFSRDDEKISQKSGKEPDEAELVSLSKRLVENAVLKAVQQYIEESQTKIKQTDGIPVEPTNNEKNENNTATKK